MRCMHVSFNSYPKLKEEHSTKYIWKELMKGFQEYHILARGSSNKFSLESEGNLYLHSMPKGFGNKMFFFEQFILFYYIKKYKINFLIVQCCLLGGIAGVLCSKLYKIPVFVEIHGNHYFDIMNSSRFRDKILSVLIKWVYKNATGIRVLNMVMKNKLEEQGIMNKSYIIQNRVNLELFSPPKIEYTLKKEIILISVGSFVELKGHFLLIDLVKKLNLDGENIKLILIGGGKLKEKYILETKGSTKFKFFDKISQKEIVKFLKEADIYIHPSYSEAVPRAIIEAMAMGLPIIASNVGMTSGLIDNEKNGLLFSAGDKEELEQKVKMLIKNYELRKKLGQRAYFDAVSKYEWKKNFNIYRNVLKEIGNDKNFTLWNK